MKIICLNTWGGRLLNPLLDFLKEKSKEVDIFCLQEIYKNKKIFPFHKNRSARQKLFYDIEKILPNFKGIYSSFQDNYQGMAIFFRKSIDIKKEGDIFVLRSKNSLINEDDKTLGKTIQYIQYIENNLKTTIINFHGICGGKRDRPDRIEQSKNIRKFLDNLTGRVVFCGDFNIDPDTKSMNILEEGMINLIKKNKIKSTRTKFYSGYDGKTRFADYILISKNIKILDFKILSDEISDHSPIYFEFE